MTGIIAAQISHTCCSALAFMPRQRRYTDTTNMPAVLLLMHHCPRDRLYDSWWWLQMLFREAAQLWSTCKTARLASEDTLQATALSSTSVASGEHACDAPLCSEGAVPAQRRDEGTQPDLGSFPRHEVLQQAKEARDRTVCVELPLHLQQQKEDTQEQEQGQDRDACGDSDSQCSLELPGLPSTQSKRTHRSLDFKQ